jgi:hypothetical protein
MAGYESYFSQYNIKSILDLGARSNLLIKLKFEKNYKYKIKSI